VARAVEVMKAGAVDCIETPVKIARFLAAVAVLCNHADHNPFDPRKGLTRTERNVLQHILDGRTTRQIATLLSRSPRTVEVHRRHIMQKLGAANIADLVRQMMEAGLIHRPADESLVDIR